MLHVSFVAAAHRGSVRNGHRQAAYPWPGPPSPPGATTLAPSSHLSPGLFRAQSSRYLLWMRLLSVFTLKTPNRAVRCVKGDSDGGGAGLGEHGAREVLVGRPEGRWEARAHRLSPGHVEAGAPRPSRAWGVLAWTTPPRPHKAHRGLYSPRCRQTRGRRLRGPTSG